MQDADNSGPRTLNEVEKTDNELVLSFLAVRRAVGSLGLLLPVMLLALATTAVVPFEPSISEFYFTPVREVMVATIGAIAVFLYSYSGFSPDPDRIQVRPIEKYLTDRNVSFVAATGALGVALFPTSCVDCLVEPQPYTWLILGEDTAATLHAISALTFFLALAVMCRENFTRIKLGVEPDAKKAAEIRIYRLCGQIIFGCAIALIVLIKGGQMVTWLDQLSTSLKLVFWVETLGLAAFALSWFIKGETLTPVVAAVQKLTKSGQAAK